jgi:hypothetical protein
MRQKNWNSYSNEFLLVAIGTDVTLGNLVRILDEAQMSYVFTP